ncbi:MAG: hypothetical protein RMY28_038115 [Nostoc sp. ChiSLP01]
MGTIGSLVYREGLRQIAIRQTQMVSTAHLQYSASSFPSTAVYSLLFPDNSNIYVLLNGDRCASCVSLV